MKRLVLVLFAAMLLMGCAAPAADESPRDQQQLCLPEDYTQPYLNPLEITELNDAEELFDLMRVRIILPAEASGATYSLVTTRRGTLAAQARFWYGERLYYYRVAYTVDETNISDDERSYLSIEERSFEGQDYTFCSSDTAGRVQWYDELSGTSRSLFTPSELDSAALEALSIQLMTSA